METLEAGRERVYRASLLGELTENETTALLTHLGLRSRGLRPQFTVSDRLPRQALRLVDVNAVCAVAA